MSLVYVHLSDIHFGQEKGGLVIVNDDVKEQLIVDVRNVIYTFPNKQADGIIVSGDIAYAGKKNEYEHAGQWLDRLTAVAGCLRTSVQVVPGNHDIDLSLITHGAQTFIDDIAKNGDSALDSYLVSEQDREILYHRFSDYRVFAEAYNCPLDGEGTIQGHRIVKIANDKYLKFYGINTALICSKNKSEEGTLLLGQRQRVIPIQFGIEVVVIAHHPLSWLQDSEDALRYIKNRARVFISGHEHMPSHNVEPISEHADLLSLASGATVPPAVNEIYTYCYNILEFDWDDEDNALKVKVYPRIWDDEKKAFTDDTKHFHTDKRTFILKCPNYKTIPNAKSNNIDESSEQEQKKLIENEIQVESKMSDTQDKILLLKFFRELSSGQRLEILVKMGAIPSDISDAITHNVEVMALKSLFASGKHIELQNSINEVLSQKIDNKND